jgi:probable rRNA maturation factor
MITIKKNYKKIPFDTRVYKKKAQIILDFLDYSDFDLSVILTSDGVLMDYNTRFRNKNKPTDILSFPFHPHAKPGKKIQIIDEDEKILGDLMISLPYVYENKHNLPGTFEQRMDRMLVHGICHLLGYDHELDADYKKMIRVENKLLKLIS